MILLVSDDLLDASKTIASAQAAGIEVRQCKSLAALIVQMEAQAYACCIVDLQCPGLDIVALLDARSQQNPRPRIVAYGSHVDAARLKAAREMGCEHVLPRSQYFAEMPGKLGEWVK
jgi:DNA-binding NarL/FixJ family response regulator